MVPIPGSTSPLRSPSRLRVVLAAALAAALLAALALAGTARAAVHRDTVAADTTAAAGTGYWHTSGRDILDSDTLRCRPAAPGDPGRFPELTMP